MDDEWIFVTGIEMDPYLSVGNIPRQWIELELVRRDREKFKVLLGLIQKDGERGRKSKQAAMVCTSSWKSINVIKECSRAWWSLCLEIWREMYDGSRLIDWLIDSWDDKNDAHTHMILITYIRASLATSAGLGAGGRRQEAGGTQRRMLHGYILFNNHRLCEDQFLAVIYHHGHHVNRS